MKSFAVPEFHVLPDLAPHELSAVEFIHFVLTAMLRHDAAILTAKFQSDTRDGAVVWYVTEMIGKHSGEPAAVATSSFRSSFRVVLARFGYHYMDIQLYGGNTTCLLTQCGQTFLCSITMSNGGQSGYWIEIQSRRVPEEVH